MLNNLNWSTIARFITTPLPLYIEVTLANFQSFGTMPATKDMFYRSVSERAMTVDKMYDNVRSKSIISMELRVLKRLSDCKTDDSSIFANLN